MTMYNKIFTKILDSSIWLEPTPTRIVWITLLAAMDQDGYAHFSAIENLAHRAKISIEDTEEAIKVLTSPDSNSADPEFDGRRIERVPGGFVILNAEKHKQMVTRVVQREQTRKRVAKHREKNKCNAPVTIGNDLVTPSVSYTEADTDTKDQNNIGNEHARSPCPTQKIIDLYHKKLTVLPKCIVITETRKRHLSARWREIPDLNLWGQFFEKVAASKFLTGRVSSKDRKPFKASLDWLIKPENFAKVLEGKYS